MTKYWAFVDYENVGTLESIDLGSYERLFVFVGPRHKKLNLGDIPTDAFSHLEIIRMKSTGKNNLDFHLAFYLGAQHQVAENSVGFHVISNDTGFQLLINHIESIGRHCKAVKKAPKKVAKKAAKKVAKKAAKKTAKKAAVQKTLVAADLYKAIMQLQDRNRPSSHSALVKWACSHFNLDEKSAEVLYASLMNSNYIEEVENGVVYRGENP